MTIFRQEDSFSDSPKFRGRVSCSPSALLPRWHWWTRLCIN